MPTALKEQIEMAVVPPFTVEFCHPRHSDILLQSIPGQRMRSEIGQVTTNVDGTKKVVSGVQGAVIPSVPGMRLKVNPAKCTYKVSDPLNNKPEIIEQIAKYVEISTGIVGAKLKGVDTFEGTLDKHRMKTLCREIINIMKEGDARMAPNGGAEPELKDVEKLPGYFLLNPGSTERNTLPYFEKDMDAWYERHQQKSQ